MTDVARVLAGIPAPLDRWDAAQRELGALEAGTVVVEPFDSEYGRVAVLADPQGAAFSVIEPSEEEEEPADPYDD